MNAPPVIEDGLGRIGGDTENMKLIIRCLIHQTFILVMLELEQISPIPMQMCFDESKKLKYFHDI